MPKPKKTATELEAIGLQRVRVWPGCRGVAGLTLTLDEDGEWSFELFEPGAVDIATVRKAATAVSDRLHDEFDLQTDTESSANT